MVSGGTELLRWKTGMHGMNDKHYSLKLLGPGSDVKGSFRNIVEHFRDFNHVIYLDARRVDKDQGLQFGEFLVTLENFLDIFVVPFLKVS